MKETVQCPRCYAELDPSADSCPRCMRPRDRPEIMRGIIALQQAPERRGRDFMRWILLAGLVIIGVLLGWRQRRELAGACRSAKTFAVAWLGLDADLQAPGRPPVQTSSSAAQAEPLSLVSAPPAVPAPALEGPAVSSAVVVQTVRPDYWLIRGLVYDLYTLKPVSGAQVSFASRDTGEKLLASTDRTGHYSLKAPRLSSGGYDVTVRHPRYRDNYLDENDPPYRQMGLERRKDAGILFLQSNVLHVPFLPPFDEDRPFLDLVLMPR